MWALDGSMWVSLVRGVEAKQRKDECVWAM